MRKQLFLAGVAATLIIPTMAATSASAQDCVQRSHDNRTAGTIIGAIGGALLGNAVSKHGGKPGGTIIGGVAGAAVGNQIGRKSTKCENVGYYDANGVWHSSSEAYAYNSTDGYYDSDGYWHSTVSAPYRGYTSYSDPYAVDYSRTWRDGYGRRCSYRSRWVDDEFGTRVREYYTVCR